MMKPTILIVDDDEKIRDFLTEALGEEYSIVPAGEGHEGLSEVMVGDQNIDLVITDLGLDRRFGHLSTYTWGYG